MRTFRHGRCLTRCVWVRDDQLDMSFAQKWVCQPDRSYGFRLWEDISVRCFKGVPWTIASVYQRLQVNSDSTIRSLAISAMIKSFRNMQILR